jgi:hypothetical protein
MLLVIDAIAQLGLAFYSASSIVAINFDADVTPTLGEDAVLIPEQKAPVSSPKQEVTVSTHAKADDSVAISKFHTFFFHSL